MDLLNEGGHTQGSQSETESMRSVIQMQMEGGRRCGDLGTTQPADLSSASFPDLSFLLRAQGAPGYPPVNKAIKSVKSIKWEEKSRGMPTAPGA